MLWRGYGGVIGNSPDYGPESANIDGIWDLQALYLNPITFSIVTDGLILNLDAGNIESYPGSGTTWTDLSGNSNNGTLINGVGYSSDNGGSMAFDGVNDHIFLPDNFFPYPSLTTFTISLWFKSLQTSGAPLFAQQDTSNPSSASGRVPVISLINDGRVRIEPFWTGTASNEILSSSTLNDNNWHLITTTYDSGVNKLYVDGVYDTQQTGLTLSTYTTDYYYYIIGAGSPGSRSSIGSDYFSGNISNFSFYNRALSDSEIQQNFDTLKGRYGL